jgi:hypothetical protein
MCAVFIAVPVVAALADNVQNDVGGSGITTITAGGSTTVNYRITANNGDGQTGCNAADSSPATVTINKPAAVTASTSTLTFTSCGTNQPVTFSSNTPGDYNITVSVSDSGAGSYNVNPASFTLHVNPAPPPANTAPTLTLPANITKEATGPNGAQVTYNATATDAQDDPDPTPVCSPASGSQFPVGTTQVNCSVTDSGNLTTTGMFSVTVQDTTAPSIAPHDNVTAEATSADGAVVNYTNPTASDLVDSSVNVNCSPASGSQFSLGTTQVTCTATDDHGNTAHSTFIVTVEDTTGPVLSLPDDITEEATGPNGAVVTYNASAEDAVDGAVAVDCTPASGATFALGETTVDCSATDAAGNESTGSFTVTVEDTTPPELNLPDNITEEATGPNGNVVNYNATASDLVDGSVSVNCSPASGSQFPIATTTVNCSATDAAGNESTGSFTVKVQDTLAPTDIQFVGDIDDGDSFFFGEVPNQPTCTATDGGSGLDSCVVSGYSTAVGTHTLKATAKDKVGNTSTKEITYTVKAWTLKGFYQPVDMGDVLNTVKNGSTVPVKFELFKGITELTSTSAVSSISAKTVSCTAFTGDPEDVIETVATGGTSLRYDATGGQFIYNWQTPKKPNTCYNLTMTATDGSTITAYFKLK